MNEPERTYGPTVRVDDKATLIEPHDFREELRVVMNKYSVDNDTNTPDFVLANYLNDCLKAWDTAVRLRDYLRESR